MASIIKFGSVSYTHLAPENMAKLKAAAPKTWNYFASLEANNWGLAEPALEAN